MQCGVPQSELIMLRKKKLRISDPQLILTAIMIIITRLLPYTSESLEKSCGSQIRNFFPVDINNISGDSTCDGACVIINKESGAERELCEQDCPFIR